MSVCDSASVDIESDGTIAAGETATISGLTFRLVIHKQILQSYEEERSDEFTFGPWSWIS